MSKNSEGSVKVKNVVLKDAVDYHRKEYKYFVPNSIVDIVIPDLLMHLDFDAFSKNGFYPIYTVYFDTIDLQTYSAKMAGLIHRKKFRVRSYHTDPNEDEPVFIEVKEKNGQRIFKRRTAITLDELDELINRGGTPNQESSIYKEWRYEILRNNIKPFLLNYYERLAFESVNYPGLRITIDRDIGYAMTNEIKFDIPIKKAYWANGKSVIEIKFDHYLPLFIVEMIRRYNLTVEPVSKYADSVISNFFLNTT